MCLRAIRCFYKKQVHRRTYVSSRPELPFFLYFRPAEATMHDTLLTYLAIQRMASFQVALIALKANRPAPTTLPRSQDRPAPTKGESQL